MLLNGDHGGNIILDEYQQQNYLKDRNNTMHFDSYEIIGLIGVFLTLVAYLFLNMQRMVQNSLRYLLLNAIGSAMILASIIKHWNIAAFVMEAAWLLISFYGLLRLVRYMNKNKK